MVADNFEQTLQAFARRAPFRPFTVELAGGDRIEIDHPEALVYRAGVAVFINPEGYPAIFDHESVSQFIGEKSPARPNGRGRRPHKGLSLPPVLENKAAEPGST